MLIRKIESDGIFNRSGIGVIAFLFANDRGFTFRRLNRPLRNYYTSFAAAFTSKTSSQRISKNKRRTRMFLLQIPTYSQYYALISRRYETLDTLQSSLDIKIEILCSRIADLPVAGTAEAVIVDVAKRRRFQRPVDLLCEKIRIRPFIAKS